MVKGRCQRSKSKLAIQNEKSCLTYSLVVRFPFSSPYKRRIRYVAGFIMSVVSIFGVDAKYEYINEYKIAWHFIIYSFIFHHALNQSDMIIFIKV